MVVTLQIPKSVLETYKAQGRSCLDHFNGMFAFALYDSVRSLFCARDRYGESLSFSKEPALPSPASTKPCFAGLSSVTTVAAAACCS